MGTYSARAIIRCHGDSCPPSPPVSNNVSSDGIFRVLPSYVYGHILSQRVCTHVRLGILAMSLCICVFIVVYGMYHRWELTVLRYHKILVIFPYPFFVVINQLFSNIIFINYCICILTGSPGKYLFMIVYVIQKMGLMRILQILST